MPLGEAGNVTLPDEGGKTFFPMLDGGKNFFQTNSIKVESESIPEYELSICTN